jgi:hypothetical protein
MTKEALKLALEALENCTTWHLTREQFDKNITAIKVIKQALAAPVQKGAIGAEYQKSPWDGKGISMPPPAAPVQVFDHVAAARQGLRDAQNRSRQISNLTNCGTCGYPLAPEERTSLIERDGVMVKPAPMTKDEAISTFRALDLALEVLESERDKYLEWGDEDGAPEDVYDAITAIKQARSAPVQEPNEWLTGCPECGMDSGCDCDSGIWNPPAAPVQEPVALVIDGVLVKSSLPEKYTGPLYTAPPAATDLQAELDATNRQVEILSDALAESRRDIDAMIALARADEREQIKEENQRCYAARGNT